jgi:hypothetical protein
MIPRRIAVSSADHTPVKSPVPAGKRAFRTKGVPDERLEKDRANFCRVIGFL